LIGSNLGILDVGFLISHVHVTVLFGTSPFFPIYLFFSQKHLPGTRFMLLPRPTSQRNTVGKFVLSAFDGG
jgi:hypothetical protein